MKRNRIAYAAPQVDVPTLNQLATALRQVLITADFPFENYEFNSHVTLLCQVGHALESQAITSITWWIDSFVLVKSVMTDNGSHYQILQKWPLLPMEI